MWGNKTPIPNNTTIAIISCHFFLTLQTIVLAKRTAMNTPIQGSAADIIKIAMVNVDKKIEELNLKSKLLVTVHDELVFEVFKGEEERLQKLVRDEMENAVKLNVPLVVDDSFGNNWYEVK